MTDLQHQIYVSYADADQDWVIDLVKNLKVCLREQLSEIDDNFIWGKYMLKGISKVTDSQIHLKKTQYLLVILSPAYLKSIGNKEIDLFNDIEHVIVVEHDKIQKPDVLLSSNGYQFWTTDDQGRQRQLSTQIPVFGELNYHELLNWMGHDIAAKIEQEQQGGESISSQQPSSLPQCFIVTVTDTEDEAFRTVIGERNMEVTLRKHKNQCFWYNSFLLNGHHCALVRPIAKGNLASQALVSEIVDLFKPKLIIMTGVCGGFKEHVKLNNVIFAQSVFGYEHERLTSDAYKKGVQPHQYHATPNLLRLIASFKAELLQKLSIKGVQIYHEKSLASGDKLLAQREHELRQKISDISRDIYGIEMEGAGFFHAIWSKQTTIDAGIIKAVSDFGDETMSHNKLKKQLKAAEIAAKVTVEVITKYFENSSVN